MITIESIFIQSSKAITAYPGTSQSGLIGSKLIMFNTIFTLWDQREIDNCSVKIPDSSFIIKAIMDCGPLCDSVKGSSHKRGTFSEHHY